MSNETKETIAVFDFFCGCGGTSRGFQKAGMDIAFALDIDQDAKNTFTKNFPETTFCDKSITSLIDACHIVQFAESHDDAISNGFSLCPTLHRAFDRGLIGIDDSYKVIVSSKLCEVAERPYSIRQLEGTQIRLPSKQIYYPGRVNFEAHREKWCI